MCGSCHLVRVSNVEIGIEYECVFLMLNSVKHILGQLQGLGKGG